MLVVYVNVGCLAFKSRGQGAAQGATRGALAEEPTANFRSVLEWAASRDKDGRRVYALMGLSSTKIRPARLELVRLLLLRHGYRSRASQARTGGAGRQRAGVLTAWDPTQLKAVPLEGGQLHRTVVQGRHMIMRFNLAGLDRPGERGHLLDFSLRYMHVRGSHAGAPRDEVNRAWERANHADLQLHRRFGKLMTGGDWNAEPAEARDPAARVHSNDVAIQDFEDGSGLIRLGNLEPTYVHEKGTSVIDHVYVSPATYQSVESFRVIDGVECSGKRHKALIVQLNVDAPPVLQEVERRTETEPVCTGGRSAVAACVKLYKAHLPGRLQSVLVRARRKAGLPELTEPKEAWPEHGTWLESARRRTGRPLATDERLNELRRGLSDAQTVQAIQAATVEAMRLAVAGRSPDDGRLEELAERRAPKAGQGRDQSSPDVRLRAAEVALRARLAVVEAPLITERDFRSFLPAKESLDGGTPRAYKGFAVGSAVRREVRTAYGAAVATSFQRAYAEAGLGDRRAQMDDPEARSPELSLHWRRAEPNRGRALWRKGAAGRGRPSGAGHGRTAGAGPAEQHLRQLLGGDARTPVATLWRRAALRLHPDRGGDGRRFVAMNEAYEAAVTEQRSAGAAQREGQPGGMLLWQVRLARYRRRAEREAIETALEHVAGQQERLNKQREGDYWKAQLRRAAEQEGDGAFMAAVYSLASSLVSGVFGKAGSGKGGAASIAAVHEEDDPDKPLITDPRRVLDAVAEFSRRMNEPRTSNVAVTIDLMRGAGWHVEGDGAQPQGQADQGQPGAGGAIRPACWRAAAELFTEDTFDQALARMRVRQAVGTDGWRGVLLRWAEGWARSAYLDALRGMLAAWGGWPTEWNDWLVTMIEKKGKDPRVFANLRDIWQSCHGWKIFTGMTRLHYQAIGDTAMPNFASGFRQRRNGMEAVLTTALAGEQAAALCAPIARGFVDLRSFFMGVSTPAQFALEHAVGVASCVSECHYAFAMSRCGRVDTGVFGLAPRVQVAQGLGQGCSNAPDRAMIDLLPAQLTAARLVPGFGFVSRAGPGDGAGRGLTQVLQGWFADDANAVADRPLLLVLFVDVLWLASFVSGNRFGIDSKGRKTAITAALCDAIKGLQPDAGGWKVQLPDEREVPMITSKYCLLGNDVTHSVDGVEVLNMIEHRAKMATWLISRTVGMERATLDKLLEASGGGVLEYYGRAYPVGWERAERVERERRKAYARSGHRARLGPRLQVYADCAVGGLGATHFYARAAAAYMDQVDLALNGDPSAPAGVAFASALARVAVQLGYVPSEAAPTPLDFWPVHLQGVLRSDQRVEAFLLYALQAGVRPTSTVALRTGTPASLSTTRWRRPVDAGGAEVWSRYGLWSRFLGSVGVVRWADLYGGIEWVPSQQRFGGYWMSFEQLLGYYNFQPRTLSRGHLQRARMEHAAVMHAIEADGEAGAWMWAYATLRGNDVPEEQRARCVPGDPLAHTVPECGPPSEQAEVQAELERLDDAAEHGDRIDELLDEREGGAWRRGQRQRLYLVRWAGYGVEQSTWQSAAQLVQSGAGTVQSRQREVAEHVAELRQRPAASRFGGALATRRAEVESRYGVRLRDPLPEVLDFNLLPALEREFAGERGGWQALRTATDLAGEDVRLRRALAVMEMHAYRTAQPEQAGIRAAPADAHAAWPDVSGTREAWRGQTHLPGETYEPREAQPDPATVCDSRAEADAFLECLRREMDVDGFGDVDGGDVSDFEEWQSRQRRESEEPRRGQPQYTERVVRPVWPSAAGPGRLVPSLAPAGPAEVRRLQREGELDRRATEWAARLAACLVAPSGGGSVWRWQLDNAGTAECRGVGMTAAARRDPIVLMFSPWPEAETPLAPGARRGTRRLYRGLTEQEVAGDAPPPSWSEGTDRAHALAIAYGAKAEAGGVSYTKDPLVAAAFAVGGSGRVACYDQGALSSDGTLHDFSGAEGAARLAAALPEQGAGRLAATYAAADAEVRADGPPRAGLLHSFQVSKAGGPRGKKEWRATAEQHVVDAVYDDAAWCESRGARLAPRARYADGGAEGPALRMEWAEAALLSSEKTAAMAAMALDQHAIHGFTHACATDGGKGNGPPRSGADRAEERTAFGLVAYSARTGRVALGGALPPGSTVQDAEMHALLACARWAAGPNNGDSAVSARRLYILSDSSTQLGQVEKAFRGPGPRGLRGAHRRGALEEFTRLRLALAKVVTQFVRSHEGVGPNAHADMVATAFMRARTADVHARRQAGYLEFRLVSPGAQAGAAVPADRAVRGLVLQRMRRHVVRRLLEEGGGDSAGPAGAAPPASGLLDWAALRGEPSALWTALLRRTSSGGSANGGGGRASDVGAVMMARAWRYGLPVEYDQAIDACAGCGLTGASALAVLRCAWQCGEAEAAEKEKDELEACLTDLRAAVGRAPEERHGAFHGALDKGYDALRRAALAETEEDGDARAAAAVLGGMLPQPTQPEWRATQLAAAASDPSLLAGVAPIRVQARAAQQAADAVKCAAGVVARAVRAWRDARRAEEGSDGGWLDDDERHDAIDRTEADAAAAGLDDQVDEEEHFNPDGDDGGDGGGGRAGASGAAGEGPDDARGGGDAGGGGDGGGGAAGSSGGCPAGSGAEGDAADGDSGVDSYVDSEGTSDEDAARDEGPDSDSDAQGRAASGDGDETDDSDDPDWEPARRQPRPLRPWHTAETAGRIGQVVLLRVQHGYERPPGVTVARLLHNRRTPAWRPGLGEAARPAAAALLQALLGWTAGEPVPASEAFARDGPTWRQEADAGAAPVEEPAPPSQPAEPWEVEDGPTADGARVVEGAEERRARRRAGKAWGWNKQRVHREAREGAQERNDRRRQGHGEASRGGRAGHGPGGERTSGGGGGGDSDGGGGGGGGGSGDGGNGGGSGGGGDGNGDSGGDGSQQRSPRGGVGAAGGGIDTASDGRDDSGDGGARRAPKARQRTKKKNTGAARRARAS